MHLGVNNWAANYCTFEAKSALRFRQREKGEDHHTREACWTFWEQRRVCLATGKLSDPLTEQSGRNKLYSKYVSSILNSIPLLSYSSRNERRSSTCRGTLGHNIAQIPSQGHAWQGLSARLRNSVLNRSPWNGPSNNEHGSPIPVANISPRHIPGNTLKPKGNTVFHEILAAARVHLHGKNKSWEKLEYIGTKYFYSRETVTSRTKRYWRTAIPPMTSNLGGVMTAYTRTNSGLLILLLQTAPKAFTCETRTCAGARSLVL